MSWKYVVFVAIRMSVLPVQYFYYYVYIYVDGILPLVVRTDRTKHKCMLLCLSLYLCCSHCLPTHICTSQPALGVWDCSFRWEKRTSTITNDDGGEWIHIRMLNPIYAVHCGWRKKRCACVARISSWVIGQWSILLTLFMIVRKSPIQI